MGVPVGPTGCNAAGSEEEPRPVSGFQIAAMHGRSLAYLRFDDGTKPVVEQQTAVGSLGYFFRNGWSIAVSGGVVFAGRVRGDGHEREFGPGWLVSARVAWRWLEEDGPVPFVVTSVTASLTRSEIDMEDGKGTVVGTDFRLGLTVGYTLFGIWRIHVSPRVFGGPIFISDDEGRVRGSDRFFFQVGLGTALLMPAGFTLFLEGSPGAEQSLSGGVAFSF